MASESEKKGGLKLHWQVLIALVLAVIVGLAAGKEAGLFGVTLYEVCGFVGSLFLRGLRMLVVPLVLASIITGVAGVGGGGALGRMGLKTFVYYISTSLFAILVGVALVQTIRPGIVDGQPARDLIGLSEETAKVTEKVGGKGAREILDVLLRTVPENPVAAAAEGDMLALIFFALLFGYFITKLPEAQQAPLRGFWEAVNEVMLRITDWVMQFAPIGVFALVAKVVMATGFGAFRPLLAFTFTVAAGLLIHSAVVLPLIVRSVGRVSPLRHVKAMAPALLMAFSTASSAATLPLTMDCVERRAGVSNRVTSFVLPLGATVNMDGTALYECVAAMFIAQAYGVDLSFAQQFTVVLIALLSSIGVAAIPSASLVAITLILTAIGLPGEAIGLILAVDRILDMGRTTVNVFSDSCGAVIVGRLEGEVGILVADPANAERPAEP